MQQKKNYRQVPNFNFIPPEYQKPAVFTRRFSLRLLFVLVIVAEVFFIQNLYQEKLTLEESVDSIQQKIQQVEEKTNIVNTEEALKQEHQVREDTWRELRTNQADWPGITSALFLSKPQGVTLFSIKQDGGRVIATGITSDYAALIRYHRVLQSSPAISQIISLTSKIAESSISFTIDIEVKMGESDA